MYTDAQFQKAAAVWGDYLRHQAPSEPAYMSPRMAFPAPSPGMGGSTPDDKDAAPTLEYLRKLAAVELTRYGDGCSVKGRNRDWVIEKHNINAGAGSYISIKRAGNDKPEMVLQDDGRIQWELSSSNMMEIKYPGQVSSGHKPVREPFYDPDSFEVRYTSKQLIVPVKAGETYLWRSPGFDGRPPRDDEMTAKKDTAVIVTAVSGDEPLTIEDVKTGSSRIASMLPADCYNNPDSKVRNLTGGSTDTEIDEFLRHYYGDTITIEDKGGYKEAMILHPAKRAYIAQEDIQWGFGWKNVRANAGDMVIQDGGFVGNLVIPKDDLAAGKHRSFVTVAEEPVASAATSRMDFRHS